MTYRYPPYTIGYTPPDLGLANAQFQVPVAPLALSPDVTLAPGPGLPFIPATAQLADGIKPAGADAPLTNPPLALDYGATLRLPLSQTTDTSASTNVPAATFPDHLSPIDLPWIYALYLEAIILPRSAFASHFVYGCSVGNSGVFQLNATWNAPDDTMILTPVVSQQACNSGPGIIQIAHEYAYPYVLAAVSPIVVNFSANPNVGMFTGIAQCRVGAQIFSNACR